jgi:hypothetical protein
MSKRDIGQEILEGIQEIKAFKTDNVPLRLRELKEAESTKTLLRITEQHPEIFGNLA